MRNSKEIYALLFLLFPVIKSFSQKDNFANADLVTNVKVFFLNQDTSFYTKSQALNFLNDTSNYEILSSRGFTNEWAFVKIKIRGNFESTRKEKISDSLYEQNKVPLSCDYIIAYKLKGKQFYRLKGFSSNDFLLLFNKSYKKNNRASFLNKFWIDELDLGCLFDYHLKKVNPLALSCLQSCKERDQIFIQIRSY